MKKLSNHLGKAEKKEGNNIIFSKHRNFGNLTVQNVNVSGGDIDESYFSFTFYSPTEALVISEIPATEDELNPICADLLNVGGTIGAIHNHWLFDQPRIYYIHYQIIGNAEKIASDLSSLWYNL